MPRITKRQERARGLMEYQRRLALAQHEEAQRKALKRASAAVQDQAQLNGAGPAIADTDASV